MKTRNFNKLICVGLHKTGTKSFAAALRDVGLNVTSWFGINDPEISSIAFKNAVGILEKHDAAQDDPWLSQFAKVPGNLARRVQRAIMVCMARLISRPPD